MFIGAAVIVNTLRQRPPAYYSPPVGFSSGASTPEPSSPAARSGYAAPPTLQADDSVIGSYQSIGVGASTVNQYLQTLCGAGVTQAEANRLLGRAADIASKGACDVDTVAHVVIVYLQRHPGQTQDASFVLETCGSYEARHPGLGIFNSALKVATGHADATIADTLVLSMPEYLNAPAGFGSDLQRAFIKLQQ